MAPLGAGLLPGQGDQLGVDQARVPTRQAQDGVAVGVHEQVVQPLVDQHVLPQRYGTVLTDHDARVTSHGGQPLAELLGVADGGRKRHQLDVVGQVDDHLFPHRAAEPVGQVVHLVHDDEAEPGQGAGARVDHVAQHLGGHHDHRRLAVHRHVTGEQADRVGAVDGHQVLELLVAQRLDGRGVERLAPGPQRQVDGELADHGLAGPGGGRDQDAVPVGDGLHGLHLERVRLELQPGDEATER